MRTQPDTVETVYGIWRGPSHPHPLWKKPRSRSSGAAPFQFARKFPRGKKPATLSILASTPSLSHLLLERFLGRFVELWEGASASSVPGQVPPLEGGRLPTSSDCILGLRLASIILSPPHTLCTACSVGLSVSSC